MQNKKSIIRGDFMFFKNKSELEYVKEIIDMDKDFWRYNKTREEYWVTIKKRIDKFRVDENSYPFIKELKIESKNVVGPNQIDEFMTKVYNYYKEHK